MELREKYLVRTDSSALIDEHTGKKKKLLGTLVYIHPKGRYVELEFQGVNGKFRESFRPEELPKKKY